MALLNFGKRIKNRKFDFVPRYYDQEKEELEERLKRYKGSGGDTEITKARIKGGFRKTYRSKDEYASKAQKRSNRILLSILIILIVVSYIFLTKYLPRIAASFE